MTTWVHRCMIVPATVVAQCRALAEAASGPAGAGMWTTALSPTGQAPATHYISAGQIEQQFADLMPLTTFDEDGVPSTTPGRSAVIANLATQAGFAMTEAQVSAVLNAADVTEQDPFVAMVRLGLELAQLPL